MQHFHTLNDVHFERTRLAIGVYDGVHRGHQAIIQKMTAEAHSNGETSGVVTFFPNPAVVLGKTDNGNYLTTPDERALLLGELGVDVVVTVEFTPELAQLSAREFMQSLKSHLGISMLYVGDDFALGKGREGNISRLTELGQELGYTVSVTSAINKDGERISSSRIRNLIRIGEVDQAAELLGRYYRLDGDVIHGEGRGRGMGFSTANIDYWKQRTMPSTGVYATWLWVEGEKHISVSNLGRRPTVEPGDQRLHLEAHALDLQRDLYGLHVELEFVEHLRPEMRFPSVDDLIAQVNRDKETARKVLQNAPETPCIHS